jgi:hypothetical protein
MCRGRAVTLGPRVDNPRARAKPVQRELRLAVREREALRERVPPDERVLLAAVLRPVAFRAAVLRPVDFRAVAFLAVAFLAVDLRAVDFFLAVDLRAVDFFAVDLRAVDLRAVAFLAVDFFAVDLRAVDFLAVDFLAVVLRAELFFFAPDLLREDPERELELREPERDEDLVVAGTARATSVSSLVTSPIAASPHVSSAAPGVTDDSLSESTLNG